MTPCEKLGYRAGDKFIVMGFRAFGGGSIIELEYDDRSYSPLFKLISGSCKHIDNRAYCNLYFVQKIEEKEMTHQKEPHVHAEMIKAKADDTSLVVFQKIENTSDWFEVIKNDEIFHKFSTYFLCLPKHKDAVLNMLNGGESQIKLAVGWIDALNYDVEEWNPNYWYMLDDYESRIKPKKEKRWISYNTKTLQVYNCEKNHTPAEGFQVIEIEAEI